jgi:dual specificity tyrosine-phosphorylation-regulated kinase 2/3/4
MDFLGAAAFSKAVQALDVKAGLLVCLKIIKNNKDYFDQSLDEIKLLRHVNAADPHDAHGMLRLYDYFYYKARPPCVPLWRRRGGVSSALHRLAHAP